MNINDVKARMVTTVKTVSGIGQVYDHLVFATDEADVNAKFVQGGVLNAAFVVRDIAAIKDWDVNKSYQTKLDTFLVKMFYAVNEEENSIEAFEPLIDAVLLALNDDRQPPSPMGGKVKSAMPPQLRGENYQVFGPTQVLCHYAEIALMVESDILGGVSS